MAPLLSAGAPSVRFTLPLDQVVNLEDAGFSRRPFLCAFYAHGGKNESPKDTPGIHR